MSSSARASIGLAIVIAVGLGCSGSDPPGTETGSEATVAARVRGVSIDRRTETPVLLLEEIDGERVLPIWIGANEARSIQAELDDVDRIRPNTHDLAKRLLDGLDATIERVTVTELRRDIYYAVIELRGAEEQHRIDARPSDAIALAVRFDAPVFVAEALFERVVVDENAPESASEDDSIRL